MKTRVVIADDHALVRAAIKALLEDIPDIEVVGEAINGIEALSLAAELTPDILILDLSMPLLNGFDVLKQIGTTTPSVKVIVLSMLDKEEYIHLALNHGAAGYLVKQALPEELGYAIKAAKRGLIWMSPEISETVVDGYLHPGNHRLRQTLTARQIQVIRMIAEGKSAKEISKNINVTIKTAEAHRKQIMDKLNIHSVAGLVRYAVKHEIITP